MLPLLFHLEIIFIVVERLSIDWKCKCTWQARLTEFVSTMWGSQLLWISEFKIIIYCWWRQRGITQLNQILPISIFMLASLTLFCFLLTRMQVRTTILLRVPGLWMSLCGRKLLVLQFYTIQIPRVQQAVLCLPHQMIFMTRLLRWTKQEVSGLSFRIWYHREFNHSECS